MAKIGCFGVMNLTFSFTNLTFLSFTIDEIFTNIKINSSTGLYRNIYKRE